MATRRAGRGHPEEPAGPPVLSLGHFCRAPFLCFGDVLLGASRTLPLALHNPNAEAVEVRVSRIPAADRGFSVAPRAFEMQVSRRAAGVCALSLPSWACRHGPTGPGATFPRSPGVGRGAAAGATLGADAVVRVSGALGGLPV